MNGIVIAGSHSGVGKTTVASGITAALRSRGFLVQPFKIGPDYIDPSYHQAACGTPSRNLDSWLLGTEAIIELFHKAMVGKDIAIIEGVMGLYDGARAEDDRGSTAELAKLLRLPVVLVLDAFAATRSVGACALGFKSFDRELNLVGVFLNGIASEKHLDLVRPSVQEAGIPLLGYLPKNEEIKLPERHLGLVPTAEETLDQAFFRKLGTQVEQTTDLDLLLSLSANTAIPSSPGKLFPQTTTIPRISLAVAKDKAFSFYYADSLELLEAWGAELSFFSPLADERLPPHTNGVYIGGGFPELYAQDLSNNQVMYESLKRAAGRGMPIYAECGGLMYLCESLEDERGDLWPMAGIIPANCHMKGVRLTLGYRVVQALDDNPLMKTAETVRGHEFHLSRLKGRSTSAKCAYRLLDQKGRREGFRIKNVLASYVHLHFASKADLAARFIESCESWRIS